METAQTKSHGKMSVFSFTSFTLISLTFINIFGLVANSQEECKHIITGPGISPHKIVLPARYFFILAEKCNIRQSDINVTVHGTSEYGSCRVWIQILDRHDGTFIVRYKMFSYCDDMEIHITVNGTHISESPYKFYGRVYAESCDCPQGGLDDMIKIYECPTSIPQIDSDLNAFTQVDINEALTEAIERFKHAGSYSFCHYVILANKIYRHCYGQHVGFNMFMDNILLSLARKTVLPDMEFLINLGDWPLIKKSAKPLIPMFSWCGSIHTADIVLPTYDITEATLECMGRVTLDMLSVQSVPDVKWENKQEKAFWRGRDSRRERLNLIKIAREHPELFNASLTNFFFFRDEEERYGPKENHVSFFKFFDHKYQVNIDGTVAAYRFPYLLAGNSVVLKQDSIYYEHFYKDLQPYVHYIPVKADLSDLVDKVRWAKSHDDEARKIGAQGREYAVNHLLPKDIFCYHALVFKKWSQKLKHSVQVRDYMKLVEVSSDKRQINCPCEQKVAHSEL